MRFQSSRSSDIRRGGAIAARLAGSFSHSSLKLRVATVDRWAGVVNFAGKQGEPVAWEPGRLAARAGGVEVYRTEAMELRGGDRIRLTRIDTGLRLVNNQTAEVAEVRGGMVTFRLEDGRMLDLQGGDAQLRHVDRAWVSTVHAFQGRTVDTVIAAMEANHPNLTNHEDPLRRDQSSARPRGARYRRQGGAQGTARSRHGPAHRGARSGRAGEGDGSGGGIGGGSQWGP